MRWPFASLLTLLATASALVPLEAGASTRLAFLSKQLEKARDPRARAQAALMLSAMADDGAGDPLCKALSDESSLVRMAAAKALLKLEVPAAQACVSRRAQVETDAQVKQALADAQAGLAALDHRPPVAYIQVMSIRDTGSFGPELVKLAEASVRERLAHLPALLAPNGESRAQAKALLKKKNLRGFQLRPTLSPSDNGGVKLNILCASYPEQAVLGEVEVNASGADAPELIRALIPRALDEAAQNFEWKR